MLNEKAVDCAKRLDQLTAAFSEFNRHAIFYTRSAQLEEFRRLRRKKDLLTYELAWLYAQLPEPGRRARRRRPKVTMTEAASPPPSLRDDRSS